MNRSVDWTLWRSFAAVVAAGSLSGAARALSLSQPTLGRHIEALEQHLGIPLFERTLSGLKPNPTALRLLEPVELAQSALAEASMMAQGVQQDPSGSVRVTASAVVCHYMLPSILVGIREKFPNIAIELVPTDSAENLLLRESDIAIRMFRPTQLDLITKRLGELPIICCASQSYLDRRGTPQAIEDLYQHDLVGLDRSELIIAHANSLGFALTRDHFALRCDSQTNLWELIRAGLGIGFAQRHMVAHTPGMRALLPQLPVPALEVWLTTHRELFTSGRDPCHL
ncbi:LysR family transcriptional regulator [Devosia rhodophyticola]|uniref:LysR family transcriptional regulator n=1 Tax=Devosia rhodophyticola TaxID=3026423 RepID=A0ABY7YTX9_9HYPH|nr:LysR family transcriptional regulator [Devosia rhodophyticola]WDR04632.1 LysR family transcriptional regulator [Devosia rhodophyticola]